MIRSPRDPQQLALGVRDSLHKLDPGLPVFTQTWQSEMSGALFGSRMATLSGTSGHHGCHSFHHRNLRHGGILRSRRLKELGIRIALGARRTTVLRTALGRAFTLLALGSAAGLILGLIASQLLSFIVYQATPSDPVVLAGVVVAMGMLGLFATWIPAQRALAVNPTVLLREV